MLLYMIMKLGISIRNCLLLCQIWTFVLTSKDKFFLDFGIWYLLNEYSFIETLKWILTYSNREHVGYLYSIHKSKVKFWNI